MPTLVIHPPARRVSSIEDIIQDAEALLLVRITIHDLSGVFVAADGTPLLDRFRGSHRRYRACAVGYCKRCRDHCYRAVNKRSCAGRSAFLHTCWKGIVEVAVPLWREEVHIGTLFAGQWRSHGMATSAFRQPFAREVRQLAQRDASSRLSLLRGTLPVLASGLLALVDEIRHSSRPSSSRKGIIRRFIEQNAARPIGLDDLARTLHLSPSRTSHLVREQTGSCFQALLAAERLRKAKALLRSTDLTVAEIGRLAGFENECYFSRYFHARVGSTPGAYRRKEWGHT